MKTKNIEQDINEEIINSIKLIVDNGEKQKGVLTVILTGLVYKYYHPYQDVRFHQSNLDGGYSGRSFDTKYVTPFLRKNDFPAMSESGWLTRSLEQNVPYDFNYTGSIAGKGLKEAFLKIYDATQHANIFEMLSVLFQELVKKRDAAQIKLSMPSNLTVNQTLSLLRSHFDYSYKSSGASRLPSIAVYSAYKSIVESDQGRYKGKRIEQLASHTASDRSTGSIGDIQINFNDNKPFEGVEIKARPIEAGMIDLIYEKIQAFGDIDRYYLLSTNEKIDENTQKLIDDKILKIRNKHGCDVIVNGVFTTLQYFLRLTDNQTFLKNYTNQITTDDALKYEHKEIWNVLCSKL